MTKSVLLLIWVVLSGLFAMEPAKDLEDQPAPNEEAMRELMISSIMAELEANDGLEDSWLMVDLDQVNEEQASALFTETCSQISMRMDEIDDGKEDIQTVRDLIDGAAPAQSTYSSLYSSGWEFLCGAYDYVQRGISYVTSIDYAGTGASAYNSASSIMERTFALTLAANLILARRGISRRLPLGRIPADPNLKYAYGWYSAANRKENDRSYVDIAEDFLNRYYGKANRVD